MALAACCCRPSPAVVAFAATRFAAFGKLREMT